MNGCSESCPAKMWCAVSGGKDSITTADVLASKGKLAGILLIDTGIAVPDLKPFVEGYCAERGWELEVVRTPVAYENWVVRWGFPGPAQHGMIMNSLKGRAIRLWKKAHPGAELASGARAAESARRSLNAKPHSVFEGVKMHAPIYGWSTEKVWAYVKERNLPRSPAYETLHISGDCLCGAFAERDEVFTIQTFYPEVADRLLRLEQRVRDAGWVKNPMSKKWGGGKHGAGLIGARDQTKLEEFLCGSCAMDRGGVVGEEK